MISKRGKIWSNFWRDIDNKGYYKRSADYLDIVQRERVGIWNSAYINSCYLIKSEVIDKMVNDPFYSPVIDSDLAFAENNRKKVFVCICCFKYSRDFLSQSQYY